MSTVEKLCKRCGRQIDGARAQQPATKYHIDCAYCVKLKQNRESDKRSVLIQQSEEFKQERRQWWKNYHLLHPGLSTKHVKAYRDRLKASGRK